MPLKHVTETLLIVILAAVMILTGVVLSTLPDLPAGVPAWAIVMALTLAYPVAVYPLLRRNRADYEFRVIHFLPALAAFTWLILHIAAQKIPSARSLIPIFQWGFSGIVVTVFFVLLIIFVLQVIRRRVPRMAFLTALFVPYVVLAVMSERTPRWNSQIASALWAWTSTSSSAQPIAQQPQRSLPSSPDPSEEAWRQKLRDRDAADRASSAGTSKSSSSLIAAVSQRSNGKPVAVRPPKGNLSSAGPEDFLILIPLLAAAYCGVLHRRAKRRIA